MSLRSKRYDFTCVKVMSSLRTRYDFTCVKVAYLASNAAEPLITASIEVAEQLCEHHNYT